MAVTDGSAALARSTPIDLAREADFAVGSATVRPSLSEVLASGQTIRLQPRVMQVLVALVRAGGEVVSRDDLLASCWGGLAIGDDAINRCIGRLRRLAEEEAPGSFAIETLARIGYRLTPLAAADSAAPRARRRRLTPWRIGLAATVLLALAAGAWFALGRPGWPQPRQSIAVMSFDAPPGDPLARNFADGVADEVASALAKADLKPLPPGAGGGMTSLQRDVAAVRLGAAFVLGGRVERDGDDLHVTVALDDARRHELLWSADFTRPAAQAQAMQEQVAAKIADVLYCTLDANTFGGRIPRRSLSLYLRACDSIETDGSDKVRDMFRQVVAREPRFANAWANLAMASAVESRQLPPDLAAAARQEALTAADRALKLDPKAGVAYVALNILLGPGNLWDRQRLLLKGLSVSPNNALLNFMESELLGQAGRTEEAIAYDRRAVLLKPLFPDFVIDLAGGLAAAGRLDEARALLARAERIWPDSDVQEVRIGTEARWGDPGIALALLDDPKTRPSDWDSATTDDWRRFSLVRRSHDPARVAAYAGDVLERLSKGKLDVGKAVRELVGLGATDAAFAAANWSRPADVLDTEPLFRPPAAAMRRDPRFMPLAAKLGLVDFWRRTGRWPDFCQALDRPYDCRAEAAKLAGAR